MTTVTPERIVHMANQIALYFAAYPQERAEAGVQEHLQKFWTPAMRRDLATYIAGGPTEAELQAAKDYLINGFALRFDSNRKLLDNVVNIAWNGLPLDYLDTWTQRVRALTADEVRRAMQRVVKPDRMATVIVGAKP